MKIKVKGKTMVKLLGLGILGMLIMFIESQGGFDLSIKEILNKGISFVADSSISAYHYIKSLGA